MPLKNNCLGSKIIGRFELDSAGKGRVSDLGTFKGGDVASPGNAPNPNLLEGFIPPGE